jgi:hypothetical protein
VLVNVTFERQAEQLLDIAKRLATSLDEKQIPYRLIAGLAVFFHVDARDPLKSRLTRDVEVAVSRSDVKRIAAAAAKFGFRYRHTAGVDMLVDAEKPTARSAVHFVFTGEKVRSDYIEPVPDFSSPVRTADGLLLAPVADLVRMKLTSFRLRDRVHIQDLDSVGLITAEIEAGLSEVLLQRLKEVRASE